MTAVDTYRNERAYAFCPGCSHRLILDALDRALVRLQWAPADVVIVSDIGCVGLSDQYFITSRFHGLHGRSLTYATGIKLAQPQLHVIALIGDGGCGIGCTHLVNAARRNIGVTTLVFNNLNFGMTGGEHSVTTPSNHRTATTPLGNAEVPLNIARTVAINGATYVWRGIAFDKKLAAVIETALTHDGFALLDIWELCVAYYASLNKVGPKQLVAMMEELGWEQGVLRQDQRTEGSTIFRGTGDGTEPSAAMPAQPLAPIFTADLERPVAVVIAGSAGAHVRTAGRLVGTAATLSGLWSTQRDDYPVTVRSGHSLSEVLISPEPILYTGIARPDVLFVLSEPGLAKVAAKIGAMKDDGWVFVTPELSPHLEPYLSPGQRERVRLLQLDELRGVARASLTLAAVAAGLASLDLLDPAALLDAAARISPAYAEPNQAAVRRALGAGRVVRP
jgi:pyruvate/2-oxoacid:ferredoxin oxidoreductase beta subunit/Pyruvate/2-oxoacid:ferredoxin oxidoreductase gamma subunit